MDTSNMPVEKGDRTWVLVTVTTVFWVLSMFTVGARFLAKRLGGPKKFGVSIYSYEDWFSLAALVSK